MRKISIALTLTALLMLPALAQAKAHHNSGNSAGDEYSENVPGAGGDHQGSGGSGGGPGSGSSLPPGTTQALQEQGSAGAGAANFANSTGPKAAKKAAHVQASGKNGSGSTSGSDSGSGSGGGLGDVVKQVAGAGNSSDSDGMGIALPIILGASILGALAFLLARRRGGSGTPGTA
jgi:hypothetical protein